MSRKSQTNIFFLFSIGWSRLTTDHSLFRMFRNNSCNLHFFCSSKMPFSCCRIILSKIKILSEINLTFSYLLFFKSLRRNLKHDFTACSQQRCTRSSSTKNITQQHCKLQAESCAKIKIFSVFPNKFLKAGAVKHVFNILKLKKV